MFIPVLHTHKHTYTVALLCYHGNAESGTHLHVRVLRSFSFGKGGKRGIVTQCSCRAGVSNKMATEFSIRVGASENLAALCTVACKGLKTQVTCLVDFINRSKNTLNREHTEMLVYVPIS